MRRASFASLLLTAVLASSLLGQAKLPTWTLLPDTRIDGAAEDLSDVNWIAVSGKGVIAIEQWKDNKILFYSAAGKRIGAFGRNGAGPGEFRQPANLGWVGDTLWVNDFRLRRTTMIGPDQKLVRDLVLPTVVKTAKGDTVGLGDVLGLPPAAMYADGSLLTYWIRAQATQKPTWFPLLPNRTPIVRMTTGGILQRLVTYIPQSPDCTVWYGNHTSNVSIPFCSGTVREIAGDGSRIAFVAQSNPTGATATYTVSVISARGDTLFTRPLTTPAIAIGKRYADSVLESRIHPTDRPVPPEFQAAYKSMTLPTYYTPILSIKLGTDATVWLAMNAGSKVTQVPYLVLDAKGSPIATLAVPKNLRLQSVSRTEVWGVESDADGLQSVARYKVKP